MKPLIDNGSIFMRPLIDYRRMESDKERGDPLEGVIKSKRFSNGNLKIHTPNTNKATQIAKITSGHIHESCTSISFLNVFCMYLLSFNENTTADIGKLVDKRVYQGFGDTAILIHNPSEFINRLKKCAESHGYDLLNDKVNYIKLNQFEGDIGPFKKEAKYSYQNEYRIVVANPDRKGTPLTLNIGPLNDICSIFEAHKTSELSFTFND